MHIDEIRRILILGAGTMGAQIAYLCARHGFEVCIYDISAEALTKARERVARLCEWGVRHGGLSQDRAQATRAGMRYTDDPKEAAREADLVSESVPEDPVLKAEIFARFHALCPPHTVFTTNTSTLLPSMLADASGRPDRFAALHFHDVRVTTIVDIMPHPGTSPETLHLLEAFCARIGQVPIVLQREQHGYVFNTMLTSLIGAALTLAANGVAAVEDIDRAWMGVLNMPIGPFGIMDQIGLNTVLSVCTYWASQTRDAQAEANAAFVKDYVDRNLLGVKTARGFYAYPAPAYHAPDFLTPDPGSQGA